MVTGAATGYAPGMDSMNTGFVLIPARRRPVRSVPSFSACCGVLALGFFSGCVAEQASYQVPTPPPPAPLGRQATTPPPVSGPAPISTAFAPVASSETTIVVTQVPQFPQQEAVQPAPSYRSVWLAGYWTWRNDGYEWVAGHWEQPPGNSTLWIRPRWVRTGGSYRFYEGHWK